MRTWVVHYVLLLQARALPLSHYIGPRDPVRVSQEELSLEDIDTYLGFLVGPDAIMKSQKKAIKPFSADLPPGNVSIPCSSVFIGGWGISSYCSLLLLNRGSPSSQHTTQSPHYRGSM